MERRSSTFLFAAAALAALGWGAWAWLRPVEVQVAPVLRGKAVDAAYATGSVEAAVRVEVRARVGGQIAALLAREGAEVRAGDLLARIDNPEVLADLERGRAELRAARAESASAGPKLEALRAQGRALASDLAQAERDLARSEKLFSEGTIAEAALDEALRLVRRLREESAANREQTRSLEIEVAAGAGASEASVRGLASRADYAEVRAPMDGVVLVRHVEEGQIVAAGEPLFKVGDARDLIVEVWVDEADVARVRAAPPGAALRAAADGAASPEEAGSLALVSLYAFPDAALHARVVDIYPEANRDRKAYLAKLRLEAPPSGMRSGMTAEANIIAAEKDGALIAPAEAVQDGAVWTLREGRLRRVAVETGIRDLRAVEIRAGLAEGDLVVVSDSEGLAEGARARAAEPAPPKRPEGRASEPPAP